MARTRQIIFCAVLTLLCFGVLTVYSANIFSIVEGAPAGSFPRKQLIYVLVSLFALALGSVADYHQLGRLRYWLLGSALVLLVLVLVFGAQVNGARRWFRFGPFSFQPSELAKLCLVIYMAEVLARRQARIREFLHGFLPPVLVLGLAFLLIMAQPDFGTAVLIALTLGAILFVAGIRLSHALLIVVLAAPGLTYFVVTEPYRLQRVFIFLDPWRDPSGAGYQLIQSFVALSSGQLFGVGPGASLQKLSFLPEASGDFAFAVLGAEMGFLGCAAVIALFCVLMWQGIRICRRAPDLFGTLLACGILAQIGLQALVNIAVVTGTMPTKGLPLPFISFGGSSLVITMFSVGLLMNIAGHCDPDNDPAVLGAKKMAVRR